MTRQEILDKAKELVRDRTPQVEDNSFLDDDLCECCGGHPDHEPEETVYVDGRYLEIDMYLCEDCLAEIEAEIANLEDVEEVEKVVYLENFR